MRNKIITITLVLVLVAGIGVLAYPFVSNMLHDRKQDKIITQYDESIDKLNEEEKELMLAEAREYNASLHGTVVLTDPFDPKAVNETSDRYMQLLNANGDGVMGYLEIPRLSIYEAIYHGTSDEVLEKGIGHLSNTSLPVGGVGTHAVVSGHTGLPEAELFTNLPEMKEGDVFYIRVLNETLAYRVDLIKVVEPSDTSDLRIELQEDYVTLVTCTPYGINSHRLLVRGTRTEYTPEAQKEAEDQAVEGMKTETWKKVYGEALLKGCFIALAILAVIVFILKIHRRRKGA